jgi:glycosyltransferase involved in cell wall biosynthesis
VTMKLGALVPRYSDEAVGGLEHWLRLLAEHVVELLGWQVEVFTTCATDATTWANELPAGTTRQNGVTIHRFESLSGRRPGYLRLSPLIRHDPAGTADSVARRYVELMGPVCPDAVAAAEESSCDVVAVGPYLYWPALVGVPRLGRKVILHAAAHDEPELHLPLLAQVFVSAGGFAFNSFAERHLVEATFRVGHLPADVIGTAVHEHAGDPAAARAALGISVDEPFVLCVGRVERTKGVHALADMWRLYRSRKRSAPRLVLLGPVHDRLISDDDVVVVGRQDEAIKWGAIRASDVLISPSAYESFGLVVLEAWLAGTPVVVNKRCDATVEHCRRGSGGLWFRSYADFEVIMDRLLDDAEMRRQLAGAGQAYARQQFGWKAVVGRYRALADRVLASIDRCGADGAEHLVG